LSHVDRSIDQVLAFSERGYVRMRDGERGKPS
jgi:hypothetical protein